MAIYSGTSASNIQIQVNSKFSAVSLKAEAQRKTLNESGWVPAFKGGYDYISILL